MNEQTEQDLITLLKGIVEVQGKGIENTTTIVRILEQVVDILELHSKILGTPKMVISNKKWFGLF